jgi:hypothetical protein
MHLLRDFPFSNLFSYRNKCIACHCMWRIIVYIQSSQTVENSPIVGNERGALQRVVT